MKFNNVVNRIPEPTILTYGLTVNIRRITNIKLSELEKLTLFSRQESPEGIRTLSEISNNAYGITGEHVRGD